MISHCVRDCRGAERPPRERRLKAGKMLQWSILSESRSSYAAHVSPTVAQIMAVSKRTGCVVFGSKFLQASLKESGLP